MEKKELAVVIPVWKSAFLSQTLQSVEALSGSKHRVYLFDDASPEATRKVLQPFLDKNPGWSYHRFENNLGGLNLAAHWNRCISACEEDWIWLFSDDDEMEPACLDAFFETLQNHPGHSVFRFAFRMVDESGSPMPVKENNAAVLQGSEFARLRFYREMDSSAVEFIFSRRAWEEEGGFPEFPAGWCADDAAWILFSGRPGIRLIPGPVVRWRFSGQSISGSGGSWLKKKLEASLAFIRWFNGRYPETAGSPSFRAEQVIWLRLQMVHQHYLPSIAEVLSMIYRLNFPGLVNRLRCFQDLYCLSYVYHCRVLSRKRPSGIRYWLSLLLPAF